MLKTKAVDLLKIRNFTKYTIFNSRRIIMRKYVFMVILITAWIVFLFSALSASNTDIVNIGFNSSEENARKEIISSDEKIRWNKTFGGSNDDYLGSLIQTDDGGYVITGETSSYGAGKADIWIIKLDSKGNKLWDKTFGGVDDDWINSLIQADDGGYVLVGKTYSFGAGEGDAWIIKLDSEGNKIWDRIFGGSDNDSVYLLIQTDDGGLAVAGYTFSYSAGRADFWLIKLDNRGNKLWERTFGGSNEDSVRSLIQTDDGGYVLAGITFSFGAGEGDFWIIKLDEKGNLESAPEK